MMATQEQVWVGWEVCMASAQVEPMSILLKSLGCSSVAAAEASEKREDSRPLARWEGWEVWEAWAEWEDVEVQARMASSPSDSGELLIILIV
jgi:hypothetical protein